MEQTVETTQEVETQTTENNTAGTTQVETPATGNNKADDGAEGAKKPDVPYKVFSSQEEFDKHSAGILHSAKAKAEKEILAMLGLKADEKDKLAKFKEAYDNTLSESEKQARNVQTLNDEVKSLKAELAEKNAVIVALSKLSGKNESDVDQYVKMAKGLVDENTDIGQALQTVMDLMKAKPAPIPTGQPLADGNVGKEPENPFKSGNMTEQGKLMNSDREKAREMYFKAFGRSPSW